MSHDTARLSDTVGPSEPPDVSLDALFDALAHPYRRRTLSQLRESSSMHLHDVAVHLVATEFPDAESSEEVRTRVALACHHVHLPRLDDAGLVTYDTDNRIVSATDAIDAAEPVLDVEPGQSE